MKKKVVFESFDTFDTYSRKSVHFSRLHTMVMIITIITLILSLSSLFHVSCLSYDSLIVIVLMMIVTILTIIKSSSLFIPWNRLKIRISLPSWPGCPTCLDSHGLCHMQIKHYHPLSMSIEMVKLEWQSVNQKCFISCLDTVWNRKCQLLAIYLIVTLCPTKGWTEGNFRVHKMKVTIKEKVWKWLSNHFVNPILVAIVIFKERSLLLLFLLNHYNLNSIQNLEAQRLRGRKLLTRKSGK